MFTHNSS